MPSERYFLNNNFKRGEIEELKGQEFHHLAHVMRARIGDQIELVNGKGALAQAIVQDVKKEKAFLRIEDIEQALPLSQRLILAQALPKSNRLDFILEKGTELGVDSFWLFPAQYSIKKEYYPSQMERAQAITIAAMKQCGRLYLPSITFQPPIEQWETLTQMSAFFGDLDPQAPLFETAWKNQVSTLYPIVFVTGPEGGFSTEEIQCLRKKKAVGVKLHHNILRTDTASLMALSLISHWLVS